MSRKTANSKGRLTADLVVQPADVADQDGVVVGHGAAQIDQLRIKPLLLHISGVPRLARLLQHLIHLAPVHATQPLDLGLVLLGHPSLLLLI